MRKKLVFLAGFLLMIGLVASVGSVRAGGWATVTLSELPTEVVAERPFTVEFSVRGHGQTLVAGLDAERGTADTSNTQRLFCGHQGARDDDTLSTVPVPHCRLPAP